MLQQAVLSLGGYQDRSEVYIKCDWITVLKPGSKYISGVSPIRFGPVLGKNPASDPIYKENLFTNTIINGWRYEMTKTSQQPVRNRTGGVSLLSPPLRFPQVYAGVIGRH